MGLDSRNNGSSKHSSESEPEAVAGEASGTNPFETFPELRVRIGSDSGSHIEMNPEMIDGSPSSASSGSAVIDQSSSIGNHLTLQPDADNEGDHVVFPVRLGSSSSSASSASSEDLFQVETKPSSRPLVPTNEPHQGYTPPVLNPRENAASSSSSSKSEDLFQVDAKLSSSPLVEANEPHQGDTPPALNPQENAASNSSTSKLEDKEDGFPGSTLLSPVSDATPEPIMSPTRSPPVQVVETIEGYDPFRIPASIFERSLSTTPLDWSVASNESLFSIHVGNNSFSRDHSFVLREMYKSGELYRTGELTKSGELFLSSPTPPLPVAILGDRSLAPTIDKNAQTFQTEESVGLALGFTDDKPEEETGAAIDEEQNGQKKGIAIASRKSSGLSLHSGGSGDSVKSFAFPVKKKKRSRSSCYGSNCSWAFCYTWPRCCFRWPVRYVSNCSWAFCYFWNCNRKRCLTDTARSGSDKTSIDQERNVEANVEEENLQPSPATPRSPKSRYCSWFYCFSSCCSWSCPQRFRCFC